MNRIQKLLLIFATATHCYGQRTSRRATMLRAASKSAKLTVSKRARRTIEAVPPVVWPCAGMLPLRGCRTIYPYRCEPTFFILTFTGIAEPTG